MLVKGNFLATGVLAVSDRIRWIHLGGATSFSPSGFVLESSDGSGANTAHYFWARDADGLMKTHTSKPSSDSDGSIASSTGATTTLSNIASVACASSLISDANNTDDLGSNTFAWKNAYLSGNLVFKESTQNLTITSADQTQACTLTIPDQDATAAKILCDQGATNAISLTSGTASITLAAGNTDLAIAAAGQVSFGTGAFTVNGAATFDLASGKDVNIDYDLAVTTEDVTLDQSVATTDTVTFGAVTSTAAATLATASTIGNLTLGNGSIVDSGSAISFGDNALTTTGTINIDADNVNLTLGAEQATDSEVWFDGTSLRFRDSATSGAKATGYTLGELATGTTLNPTVVGDLTISNGNFIWTNSDNEAATWTLSAAGATTGIDLITAAITTGVAFKVTADALANGDGIMVDADGGVGSTGNYFTAHNGSADVFTVGENGEINIVGSAGIDILTITDGDVLIDDGSFTITNDQDAATTFSITNDTMSNAGGPMALIDAGSLTDQVLLALDADSITTGSFLTCDRGGVQFAIKQYGEIEIAGAAGANMITITDGDILISDGVIAALTDGDMGHNFSTSANAAGSATDFFTITNSDAAFDKTLFVVDGNNDQAFDVMAITNEGTGKSLHITTGVAGGYGVYFDVAANHTDPLLYANLGTWLGSANEGVIHLISDGNTTVPAGQFVVLDQNGTGQHASAILGTVLDITDAATAPAGAAESYAVNIDATNIEAMWVEAGNIQMNTDQALQCGAGATPEWSTYNSGAASVTVLTSDPWTIGAAATNFASFSIAGLLTFAGTARNTKTLWISAAEFDAHTGTPPMTNVGMGRGWGFDPDADEAISTQFRVPWDMDVSADCTITLHYCVNDANAAHKSYWEFTTVPLAENELATGAGPGADTMNDTLVSATANDYNISGATTIGSASEWTAGDLVLLKVLRDADNGSDDVDADVIVFGVSIAYTSDKV